MTLSFIAFPIQWVRHAPAWQVWGAFGLVFVAAFFVQVYILKRPLKPNWFGLKPPEMEALKPEPNPKNLTQRAAVEMGLHPFDAFISVGLHNPNRSREIKGITLRILNIDPAPILKPVHDFKLTRYPVSTIQFQFDDIGSDTLKGDQTSNIRLLRAFLKPFSEDPNKGITLEFCGTRKPDSINEFVPAKEHILTIEVAAIGVRRTQADFKLSFSTDGHEPVAKLEKINS